MGKCVWCGGSRRMKLFEMAGAQIPECGKCSKERGNRHPLTHCLVLYGLSQGIKYRNRLMRHFVDPNWPVDYYVR